MRKKRTQIGGFLCIALLSFTMPSCAPEITGPGDQTNQTPGHTALKNGSDSASGIINHESRRTGKFSALDFPGSFIVDNESSQALGVVEISGSGQNLNFVVGPSEVDTIQIPFMADSVTIASQVCAAPGAAVVTLPCGAQVAAGWKDPSIIAIIDYYQQN